MGWLDSKEEKDKKKELKNEGFNSKKRTLRYVQL